MKTRFVLITGLLPVLGGAACGDVGTSSGQTSSHSGGAGGGGGDTAGAAGTGAGGEGSACDGMCILGAPIPFNGPVMVGVVPGGIGPNCPPFASVKAFGGAWDPQPVPYECPSCACAPVACSLPETMHASAAKCSSPGAAVTPFDAPEGWDGACTTEDAIPSGVSCDGAPCVQSITISPPAVQPCVPSPEGELRKPYPSWGFGLTECNVSVTIDCGRIGVVCAPPMPEYFRMCLYVDGDEQEWPCPSDYPERIVAFSNFKDERGCTQCACGEPEGASCSALVSVFSDAACGAQLISTTVVAPGNALCGDLPPGTALGSKKAAFTTNTPGTCTPSGGEPTGDIIPTEPRTYCCMPVD